MGEAVEFGATPFQLRYDTAQAGDFRPHFADAGGALILVYAVVHAVHPVNATEHWPYPTLK